MKFTKVKLLYSDEKVSFCELCYECFKANEKCDYCQQVYFSTKDDGAVDGKMWMCCDRCEKWNHPDCEIKYGKDPKYIEAAKQLKDQELKR